MGWLSTFYRSSIGKKITVAVTGAIMVLFLIGHMMGNLLLFEGPGHAGEPTRLNQYAEILRFEPVVLWIIRLVLLATVVLHVITTIQLSLENSRARNVKYKVKKNLAATLSSRTMIWGGLIVAAFIVFHILHFTTGTIYASHFEHLKPYHNVIASFQNPIFAGLYIIAMIIIFFHLNHGIKSGFETLGVTHPRYVDLVRKGGPILAFLIAAGFLLVPLAVLAGWVK
jgi:succinate dehydrogenase / fumarate reductase cytochrome b subunit